MFIAQLFSGVTTLESKKWRIKAFNFDNFDNSHNSFLWPEYFIDYFCENGFHVSLWYPSCVYLSAQRQYTAVQKNAYTSEIIFLALVPWFILYRLINIYYYPGVHVLVFEEGDWLVHRFLIILEHSLLSYRLKLVLLKYHYTIIPFIMIWSLNST